MKTYLDSEVLIADMHTHTIASKHAFSTLFENALIAKKRNLEYLFTTDHLYAPEESIAAQNELLLITALCVSKEEIDGVRLIGSTELNLGQSLPEKSVAKLACLKWKPLGIHSWFLPNKITTLDDLYKLYKLHISGEINSLIKPNAFVHIERGLTEFKSTSNFDIADYLKVIVDLAIANKVYLELNESSFSRNAQETQKYMLYWVKYANSLGAKFYFGSDAHLCTKVGEFVNVKNIAIACGIDPKNILNYACCRETLETFE